VLVFTVLCVLQGSKTPKFTRGFVLFLAFAVCKLGVEATSSSMDAVQPKIMLMILQQVRTGSRGCRFVWGHVSYPLIAFMEGKAPACPVLLKVRHTQTVTLCICRAAAATAAAATATAASGVGAQLVAGWS
jgi:hypothetical protein